MFGKGTKMRHHLAKGEDNAALCDVTKRKQKEVLFPLFLEVTDRRF